MKRRQKLLNTESFARVGIVDLLNQFLSHQATRTTGAKMAAMTSVVNYTVVFPFERTFDPLPSTIWMKHNWAHSITLSALYALFIHQGQKWMEKRPPLRLNRLLTAWNCLLATFSIFGLIRMTPEFFHSLTHFGFQYTVCNASYAHGVTGFWTQMFALSKAFELGDTVFIVLRKRPVIFLHWYHHITVLVYTWHAYKDHTAAGRWFVWMNYLVHSFMYTYYAARSLGISPPKWIPMCITGMQLAQMVAGCFVSWTSYNIKRSNTYCQQSYENLYFSFLIYTSYFVLFAHFFYTAYLRRGNRYQKLANGPVSSAKAD
ncbi:hypothetical protein M514_06590 [Trichuris suis]|uniref:Elongation of very long chain fatty acids protein n=1 Tax=Trichuris suis TaxID=68888 RepID=A0A085M5R0_9BILA|nr:hypothetical protein M513_06590 [Trichuris suis]KFD63696.1 hypothetical protein M514_06590 [Trichuris suis]